MKRCISWKPLQRIGVCIPERAKDLKRLRAKDLNDWRELKRSKASVKKRIRGEETSQRYKRRQAVDPVLEADRGWLLSTLEADTRVRLRQASKSLRTAHGAGESVSMGGERRSHPVSWRVGQAQDCPFSSVL